jgi:integrase
MKAGKEHRVPLSGRASEIVESVPRDGEFMFPGGRAKRSLSNMALLQLLRRMRRDGLTAHGFRSTFRDWAGEQTAYPREVIEAALAHTLKDKTEASYARGDLLEKRRRLMEDWARFAGTALVTSVENVVSLR